MAKGKSFIAGHDAKVVLEDVNGNAVTPGTSDATAANQALQIAAEQAILAKLIAAPATEAKQDSLISANHTDLAALLTKLTAGAASVSKLEDVASADGDAGVGLLAVRKATPANTSGADGDYEFVQMSAGRVWSWAAIDSTVRSAATTMQNAAVASGNGASLDVTGQAAALLNVVSSVAMSGGTTVNFEASVDDTTWVGIAGHKIGTNGSLATTTTADGDFRFATAGYKSLRARISAYSAGTTTIKGYAVPIASQPTVVALGTGTNSIGTTGLDASNNIIGEVGGITVTPSASSTITRPSDTTAYASGDLVANSVTAGSVNALQFTVARISGGSGSIVSARIQKSTVSVTNAAFRVHLFTVVPTFTSAGDNSAIGTVVVASAKGYLGYIDITAMVAFSDVAWGTGSADNLRGNIPFVAAAQLVYAIVEARGAYTPGNAEVFTVTLFVYQD